ncbi:MAG: GTP-binding protein [Christensenellales bacterium]|jgi:hypothetical protein
MKVAVVGSSRIKGDIDAYIPAGTTQIVSGGLRGIESLAERWADDNGVPKLMIKLTHDRFGRLYPLKRARLIAETADIVVAVWDGVSVETKLVIDCARRAGKMVKVHLVKRI